MQRSKISLNDVVIVFLIGAALVFIVPRLFDMYGVNTSGWKTDFSKSDVPMDEIISGGVPRDGIPPIDDPVFQSISEATWLQPQSPVIVMEIDGDARAYPLAVLTQHEIVNDVVGGVPVAVTFCPLCNSSIVYDRRVDGETLRFGVSGNLRNSDLIMWDDKTESWWQQLTGKGIVGTYTGVMLDFVPSQVVGFGAFVDAYPDGRVLAGSEQFGFRSYGRNPYVGYDSDPRPFLFRGEVDSRLFPTERVLAGVVGEMPVAFPFATLMEQPVINETVDGTPVVILWQMGATSALDQSTIDESKDVGMAAMFIREVDGTQLTFTIDGNTIIDDQTGSTWNIFGLAVDGELRGTQLEQTDAYPHFWFAWAAFYPETMIYQPE